MGRDRRGSRETRGRIPGRGHEGLPLGGGQLDDGVCGIDELLKETIHFADRLLPIAEHLTVLVPSGGTEPITAEGDVIRHRVAEILRTVGDTIRPGQPDDLGPLERLLIQAGDVCFEALQLAQGCFRERLRYGPCAASRRPAAAIVSRNFSTATTKST